MRTMAMSMATVFVLVSALGPMPAVLGSVVIDATARTVSATAFCSSEFCRGSEGGSLSTADIGVWNQNVGAAVAVASGGGQQNTFVFPGSIGGFGEAAGGGGGSGGSWTGTSTLSTTVVLDGFLDYSCVGILSATGFGSASGAINCAATVKLVGSGGIVFQIDAMADVFGGETEPVDLTGTLAPGTYVFSLSAMANGIASELSFGDGSCMFDLTLSLCPDGDDCRADLDGSGVVDGADLGRLLGGWGEGGAAGDLDCNGTVDGGDVGLLIAAWGACG